MYSFLECSIEAGILPGGNGALLVAGILLSPRGSRTRGNASDVQLIARGEKRVGGWVGGREGAVEGARGRRERGEGDG